MPLVNGKRKNQISIYDRGFMYGDSVFETILVKDYKPQYLNEHLSRLFKGCKFLEININKYKYLERDIKKIVKNKKNCILNIIITRGNAKKRGYSYNKNEFTPNIILQTSKIPTDILEFKNGIHTKTIKHNFFSNQFSYGIKHSNKLDSIILSKNLKKNIPELLAMDQSNNVIEGVSSNFFCLKGNTVYTPKCDQYGIEGVMKKIIINKLKKNKISIREKKINKNFLKECNGAFFCNSIRGIWPIKQIDSIKMSNNSFYDKVLNLILDL
ncbi:MAG: aminodeoxychorismate lyase [Thiotrichaceae bacterium]|nr:MAG: aminodeoxychorismate lyase [Thiotrichaceae bacterium]